VHPILRSTLLLLGLGLLAPAPWAGEMDPGKYADMAESMMDMMDAFSQAYGKRRFGSMPANPLSWGSQATGAMPWGSMPRPPAWPQPPGMGEDGPWGPMPPGLPNLFPRLPPPPPSPLEGVWLGQSWEVLVIRDGRFRIYQNPDHYREGQLRLQEDRLTMQDPESGHQMEYDYILEENHLALRDPWGGVLLYRLLLRDLY